MKATCNYKSVCAYDMIRYIIYISKLHLTMYRLTLDCYGSAVVWVLLSRCPSPRGSHIPPHVLPRALRVRPCLGGQATLHNK